MAERGPLRRVFLLVSLALRFYRKCPILGLAYVTAYTGGSKMPEDNAIIYQLDKVDQGGDVTELLESRVYSVAEAFGLDVVEDDEHPYFGYIKLPGARYAGFKPVEAYITERRLDLEPDAASQRMVEAIKQDWVDIEEKIEHEDDIARAEGEGMI